MSIWRDHNLEDEIAKLQAAPTLHESKPGAILNICKQRNGNFEGKIGLWFDQKTDRYRSSADQARWCTYLPGAEIKPHEPPAGASLQAEAWLTYKLGM